MPTGVSMCPRNSTVCRINLWASNVVCAVSVCACVKLILLPTGVLLLSGAALDAGSTTGVGIGARMGAPVTAVTVTPCVPL